MHKCEQYYVLFQIRSHDNFAFKLYLSMALSCENMQLKNKF